MLICFILIFCKVSELQMQILFGDSRWTQGLSWRFVTKMMKSWVCESERARGRKREGGMEAENADASCDVSALSWQDCVTFQRRTPSCSQREGERERERGPSTMPIEHCEAAAGGTCSDLKAIYSVQNGVPLTTLLLLKGWKWMDGQCLSLNSIAAQVCHHENGREAVPTSPNQSSSRMGTAKYQGCGRWCKFLKRSFPSYVGAIEIKLRWPSKLLFLLSADVRLSPAAEGKIRFSKRNRKKKQQPSS